MENSLPPSFSVTKRWDMHSSECKMTSDVLARMEQFSKKQGKKFSEKTTNTSLSTFLNRIRYIYVPAIKDEQVFKETLNLLQESLFSSKNKKILDTPINEANHAVQNVIGELQKDFEDATGIKNFVELPNTLNYTHGLLQVNTQTSNGLISIDKRGDGIKAHYIPKILNYVAKHSKNIFIWGFEEPENSYEYCRCMQVAKEFDEVYCQNCQVFITTHSPAFFEERDNKKIVLVGNKDGKTILMDENTPIDEELGYIALYRGFLEKLRAMQDISESKEKEISDLRSTIPVSYTHLLDEIYRLMNESQAVDVRGDTYEYLLSKIAQSGLNGQFRTPRHIIRMMVELMDPKADEVICDPACGTSGFLVAAGEYLKERRKEEIFFDRQKKDHYMNHMFFGYDMDRTMLRIGAMNMMTHGIDNPYICLLYTSCPPPCGRSFRCSAAA